jgi:hypothetical protein
MCSVFNEPYKKFNGKIINQKKNINTLLFSHFNFILFYIVDIIYINEFIDKLK